MLDFYYINKSEDILKDPDESKYVGSLDLEHFKQLYEVGDFAKSTGIKMSYFEDFRLDGSEIMKLIEYSERFLEENQKNLSQVKFMCYNKLIEILINARDNQSDMVAYCD